MLYPPYRVLITWHSWLGYSVNFVCLRASEFPKRCDLLDCLFVPFSIHWQLIINILNAGNVRAVCQHITHDTTSDFSSPGPPLKKYLNSLLDCRYRATLRCLLLNCVKPDIPSCSLAFVCQLLLNCIGFACYSAHVVLPLLNSDTISRCLRSPWIFACLKDSCIKLRTLCLYQLCPSSVSLVNAADVKTGPISLHCAKLMSLWRLLLLPCLL
jgi:hypothetical protein